MTLDECRSSKQDDNKILRYLDNCAKRPLSEDALEASDKQLFLRLRKSKSDFELSRRFDMGQTLSSSRSLQNFEMLTDEKTKKSYPEISDDSDDEYTILQTSDEEGNCSEIDASEIQMSGDANECGSASMRDQGQVQVNRKTEDLASSANDDDLRNNCSIASCSTRASSCEDYHNCSSRCSLNVNLLAQDSACFRDANERRSHIPSDNISPPASNNENNHGDKSENVDNSSKLPEKDFKIRSLTLPKTKPNEKTSTGPHSRRSLRLTIDARSPTKLLGISNASENTMVNVPKSSALKRTGNAESRRSLKKAMNSQTAELEARCDGFASTSLAYENAQPCASSDPDVFNVLLTEQQLHADPSRPRQYGRRSNPVRISSFAIESSDNGAARIVAHHQQQQQQQRRPISAPVQHLSSPQYSSQRMRESLPFEISSLESSRNSSPVSVASSSDASSSADQLDSHRVEFVNNTRNEDETETEEGSTESKIFWPHSLSRPICCLFCTLGLFNISRFAIFTVHFGANFLVQFLILSFIFGIPMLWLQMVLGQKIKGGIVTMFRITPICKGIGVALMIAHCIICLYSSVTIGWLLIYLRDSFISSDKTYLWEERFESFRGYQNISALRLSENIADYFNGVVLQRLTSSGVYESEMKLQLAFNVSIVWILVFVLLCRGIRSLGQIVIGMAVFSFLGLSVVCIKFLTLLNFETIQDIFPATDWQDFFANSNSWSVAAQEAFLTWGLLGVSVYAMYCKTDKAQRMDPFVLRREAFLVVFLTFFGLFLGAVLGSTCIIILKLNGFNYYPASFENPKNDIFLWPATTPVQPSFHHSIPSKWISRFSNIMGESFDRPTFYQGAYVVKESGYKTLRLVTEILPATLAISTRIEPIWSVIVFASLFMFGLAQLGIMWKPISGAIGNSTSAILLSCITGLFLGFPLTTDNGIVIIHYLDYIFGAAWWLLILWTTFIVAIFLVRGSPFTSDILAKELRLNETFSVFLAFSWNVLLPLALILLSIMEYKKSHSNELFLNHRSSSGDLNHLTNWPFWAKRLGGLLQLSLLIVVPIVAIVQIYIHLAKGPRDILERIELLFRPPMEGSTHHAPVRRLYPPLPQQPPPVVLPLSDPNTVTALNDAPPKYSPPPSYGRAVGARVAKALRNSIRRSVRRFRRSDDARIDAEGPSQRNVPSISSIVNDSTLVNSVNDFIRSRIQRQNDSSISVENLIMSEMPLNHDSVHNQRDEPRNSIGHP